MDILESFQIGKFPLNCICRWHSNFFYWSIVIYNVALISTVPQ